MSLVDAFVAVAVGVIGMVALCLWVIAAISALIAVLEGPSWTARIVGALGGWALFAIALWVVTGLSA
jgi:hypothetical protein